MRYRLICFDAGFTLIRPVQQLWQHMAAVLTAHGHSLTEEQLRAAWEVADRWFWAEYHRPDNSSWASDDSIAETWRAYHQVMLRELRLTDDDGTLLHAVLESQFSPHGWELYPDVRPALTTLDGLSPRPVMAVVSDWESTLPRITSSVGLDPYIEFVLASGAVGLAKPAPEYFLLACKRAGVEPSDAVMIGDSLRADVEGARSAGMDAVLLDRAGTADVDEVPAPVIRSLDELPAVLERAMARPAPR